MSNEMEVNRTKKGHQMGVEPVPLALKASSRAPNGSTVKPVLALEASRYPISPSGHVYHHVIEFQMDRMGNGMRLRLSNILTLRDLSTSSYYGYEVYRHLEEKRGCQRYAK
jgi:hypothetical protein